MEHFIIIILVMMPGVWSGEWGVITKDQCAMKGTSVVIPCLYKYPAYHWVRTVKWFKKNLVSGKQISLPSDRFVYVGNNLDNCNLLIKNIKYEDSGEYFFKFSTNSNRWTSKFPFVLSVKALDLVASVNPTTVTEEEVVTLTCQSSCNTQTNTEYVWFRDGQQVSHTSFKANKQDAGRYTCALLGQERFQSQSEALNVQYAPKNMMLSMSPSEEVIKGGAVTFTCSSEANPPVLQTGYKLFRDRQFISSGQSHTIPDIQPSDSGQYYCQAGNNIAWRGSSLFQSSKVYVNVQYRPMNISISVDSTEVIQGSDMNLTCTSDANPPTNVYTWYKLGSSSSFSSPSPMVLVGSGPVLSLSSVEVSDTGHYICLARNKVGEGNSTELLLSVKTKTKSAYLSILAGTGVSLFVVLVLALLLYWKKRRRHSDKKQTTVLSERDSSSSAGVETVDHIYANIGMFQPSSSAMDKEDYTSPEEVLYTTVTIKPKKPSQKHHTQTIAPEMDDSVIYAKVANSC